MNKLLLPFIAALFAFVGGLAAAPTNAAAPDHLSFRNGDFLFGKLLAVTPDEVLQWRHPDAADAINFTLDSVESVEFASSVATPSEPGGCKALFSNGDLLRGRLVGGDADSVTLDTAFAGRLKLPRARLQSLAMTPAEAPLLEGITGLEGWTEVSSPVGIGGEAGHWTYRSGAFYASKPCSIARDVKLPDMAQIEFDLAWRGQPNLAVALYTDSLQPILLANKENGPDFGGFYSFRLTGIVADMFPIKKKGAAPGLGSVILSALGRSDHGHFDLRVSKPQNRICLLIDKTVVMQWTDPAGFEGEGTGLRFVQNSGAIKLNNLRVSHWDGIVEEKTEDNAARAEDTLWLKSSQAVSGAITAINDQTVTMRVGNTPQTIPLAQIREMSFKTPAPRLPADVASVRATFASGGGIRGQLESWSPDGVVLRSSDFGRAKFTPSIFAALQFLHAEGN